MFTTLGDFLNEAEHQFSLHPLYFGHGTNNAWDEACALVFFVLGLPPDCDASVQERLLTQTEKNKLTQLMKKRIEAQIPVPYLSHTAWFAGLPFYVDERVIIPRSPIAELIQKRFSPWIKKEPKRILDLCTGSGCIAIACAKQFPNAEIDAVDIEQDALQVAKMNVIRHQVEEQVNLIQSDLFSACGDKRYDLIISNPPYVPVREYLALPKEYHHEPIRALEAGETGLDCVHQILKEAGDHLTDAGILIVEVGVAQDNLMEAYPHMPFTWLEFEWGGEGVFLLTREEVACCKAF